MPSAAQQSFRLLHSQARGSAPQLSSLFVRQVANAAVSSPTVTQSLGSQSLLQDRSWTSWLQELQESCSALWQHSAGSLWMAVPKRKVRASNMHIFGK